MKTKFFAPICLAILFVASSCGKKDEPAPVTTVQPVGTVTCPAGQMVYNNTCVTTINGQPPGYNGSGYTTPPPGYSCSGQYWANGYSYTSNCGGSSYYYGGYSYRSWYYWNGFIYIW